MSNPRYTSLDVSFNGVNATSKIEKYISSFEYIDVASGSSDSCRISLNDEDGKWINNWMPKKGDRIVPKIKMFNWLKENDSKVFKCGSFCLDSLSFSGPPTVCEIGGVSIPAKTSFTTLERTKTWKSTTIKNIGAEIAKRAKVSLVYDAKIIKIKSIEQNEQTDSDFLYSLCNTYGLGMKVFYNKIIIFDEAKYEKKKTVATLDATEFIGGWSYNNELVRTYTGYEAEYTNPSTGETITWKHWFVVPEERFVHVGKECDDKQDAILKGSAKVNQENKDMETLDITIFPNPKIVASSMVKITGLGWLNGNYYVDQVQHIYSADSAYVMSLRLRKPQQRL